MCWDMLILFLKKMEGGEKRNTEITINKYKEVFSLEISGAVFLSLRSWPYAV